MTAYQRSTRARRQPPAARPTATSNGNGPTYTAMTWSCSKCGATVTDQDSHNRFHGGLVVLWERGR